MRGTARRSDTLDKLVAALQSGVCDPAAARELYPLGPDAVTLALLAAARRITELQTQTAGGLSPSTPSGMRPVYTKPNAPGGRRRQRPGARVGHPGHHRPPPARIDQRQTDDHYFQIFRDRLCGNKVCLFPQKSRRFDD